MQRRRAETGAGVPSSCAKMETRNSSSIQRNSAWSDGGDALFPAVKKDELARFLGVLRRSESYAFGEELHGAEAAGMWANCAHGSPIRA